MSERRIAAARALLEEKFERGRATFVADPHVQTGAGGSEIVHFQQTYAGIPFFGGHVAVHLDDGAVLGDFVAAKELDCIPKISAPEAVVAALEHFRARSDRSMCQAAHRSFRGTIPKPWIVTSFPLPSQPTVLSLAPTKATAAAHLEFFENQLVWVVRLRMQTKTFLLLVAANGANARSVVFCTPWSSGAKCTGGVFGFDDVKSTQRFPCVPAMFPAPLLTLPNAALLDDWIEVDATRGKYVVTHFGNPETLVHATGGAFNANLNTQDQALLNAFFFCNYLHDFFLLLGFGKAEGNFQVHDAPEDGDRLRVFVFTKKFEELGQMDAHLAGKPAELFLGKSPNGNFAALHADVVIHEYAHGVSHRMVGGQHGAATLSKKQSLALDEAWSDYFAITLRNHHLGANKQYTFASWAGDSKLTRSAPYDLNYNANYGDLGKKGHDDPHGAGEIFAVALIRFNEFLGQRLGDETLGNCIGWRVVVESLRQCNPSNPTLLDGREAVFRAINELAKNQLTAGEATDARAAARQAFAKFGMGPNAHGPDSSKFGPTTADPHE